MDVDEGIVKLNIVYHIPCWKKNLISIFQITKSGKYVLFGSNDVKVLDNVKNVIADVLLAGEKKGSLFIMSVGEAYMKKTSQIDNAASNMACSVRPCKIPNATTDFFKESIG